MNENQKQNIELLRQQGFGYKKIAQQLDININTVKSYCRNHQLTTRELSMNQCKNCKQGLQQQYKTKKRVFCSTKCRKQWWNQNRHQLASKTKRVFTCRYCKKDFNAYPHEKRQYCSHICYVVCRFQGDDQ